MTMRKFQLLSICFLACSAILFTACSDDDEPCTNSQRPDFSVSFFEDGNNNPIKETKFFLPAYDDSISDLSNTSYIYYKIANCAKGHNHTDIAFDYIYSGNLKIKLVPNPTDVSCGKIIFWALIGSECKRNEQIRLYVTDEKNNTSITSLHINVVPPQLNSILRMGDNELIVYERDEANGTYKAYCALGNSRTGLHIGNSHEANVSWSNLPNIDEAKYFLQNVYNNQKDKVKGIWYLQNNLRYVMLNDGTYQSLRYSGKELEESYLVLQIYDYYIPN